MSKTYDLPIHLFDVSDFDKRYIIDTINQLKKSSDPLFSSIVTKLEKHITFEPPGTALRQQLNNKTIVIYEGVGVGEDCLLTGALGIQMNQNSIQSNSDALPGRAVLFNQNGIKAIVSIRESANVLAKHLERLKREPKKAQNPAQPVTQESQFCAQLLYLK